MNIKFITLQIVKGLAYLHSAGIIHRDLKPTNIAITKEGDVKLLDFGLARLQATNMTRKYMGALWYRAPEIVCQSEMYTTACDMWSLGTILAELVTENGCVLSLLYFPFHLLLFLLLFS